MVIGVVFLVFLMLVMVDMLKWGVLCDISLFDLYFYGDSFVLGVFNYVYEGFVWYDWNLKIELVFVMFWEIVLLIIWCFYLCDGVKFYDGVDFIVDDVQVLLKCVSDLKLLLCGNIFVYKGLCVIDVYMIEIDVLVNYLFLFNDLMMIYIFDVGWLKINNVEVLMDVGFGIEGYVIYYENGIGLFKVESCQFDVKIVFIKFDGWWDKLQYNIDWIEFILIVFNVMCVVVFLVGDIDFIDQVFV